MLQFWVRVKWYKSWRQPYWPFINILRGYILFAAFISKNFRCLWCWTTLRKKRVGRGAKESLRDESLANPLFMRRSYSASYLQIRKNASDDLLLFSQKRKKSLLYRSWDFIKASYRLYQLPTWLWNTWHHFTMVLRKFKTFGDASYYESNISYNAKIRVALKKI